MAYLVTLAAMVFTAQLVRADGGRLSGRRIRRMPTTQRSFGAPIGFLAGWSLLLDYLFLPMLNSSVIRHLT